MKKKLFGYPLLGREGLAHSLLAWARCVVWCHQTGAKMISPRWFKLRIGPYIRRERDKRNYFLSFGKGEHIGEPHRTVGLLCFKKIYAELDLPDQTYQPAKNTVVVFRNAEALNERKFFYHVAGYSQLIKAELQKITHSQYLPSQPNKPHIALHVRRGDFKVAIEGSLNSATTNTQLSLVWYRDVLVRLRGAIGADVAAVVYSDGEDKELINLLSLPNVSRAPRQAAITDLLSISDADVLITSVSGFSQWGSFLGNVPCISYPNQSLFSYLPELIDEVEIDQNVDFPEWFITKIKGKFEPEIV